MSLREHFDLLATYNEWMNAKVYEAAARLVPAELHADRGAFFGSLYDTLNHLAVGDTIWLRRFRAHPTGFAVLDPVEQGPAPTTLDERLFSDFGSLWQYRRQLDALIRRFAASLTDTDLNQVLVYANTKGVESRKRFDQLLLHFFNHQTHHRGQATTLLFQAGQDVGVTDLLVQIPNVIS